MRTLLLLLAACGGQSGENEKGDRGRCDEVSAELLADLPGEEWPEGLAELVTSYEDLDGAWAGTLRCLDEPDEAATFTLQVDHGLVLRTYEGIACEEASSAATGKTGFTLTTASFADDQLLTTGMAAGSGAAAPILMSGDGVELTWTAGGALSSAIDKYRWHEGNSSSDATCELVDITLSEEP